MSTQKTTDPATESPAEVVEEHLELLEKLAETDLPIADRCQDAVDRYHQGDLDDE